MNKEVPEKLIDFTFAFANYMKSSIDVHCNKNGKKNKDEVTMPQLHLLFCIDKLGDKCTITDIVNVTSISKSTISIMLSKLEKAKVIERVHDIMELDKRKVYIKITKDGEKILTNKKNEIFEYLKDKVSKMDIKDVMYLNESLPKLGRILRKYGESEENNGR